MKETSSLQNSENSYFGDEVEKSENDQNKNQIDFSKNSSNPEGIFDTVNKKIKYVIENGKDLSYSNSNSKISIEIQNKEQFLYSRYWCANKKSNNDTDSSSPLTENKKNKNNAYNLLTGKTLKKNEEIKNAGNSIKNIPKDNSKNPKKNNNINKIKVVKGKIIKKSLKTTPFKDNEAIKQKNINEYINKNNYNKTNSSGIKKSVNINNKRGVESIRSSGRVFRQFTSYDGKDKVNVDDLYLD